MYSYCHITYYPYFCFTSDTNKNILYWKVLWKNINTCSCCLESLSDTVMPPIVCLIADYPYSTSDVDPVIATALLTVHNKVYIGVVAAATGTKQKAPKLTRPIISGGSSEEIWNAFHARWSLFENGTQLAPNEITQQLFQCCGDALGNDQTVEFY